MILIYRKEILATSHSKLEVYFISILYHNLSPCCTKLYQNGQFIVSDRILYRNIINVVDHRGVCYLGVASSSAALLSVFFLHLPYLIFFVIWWERYVISIWRDDSKQNRPGISNMIHKLADVPCFIRWLSRVDVVYYCNDLTDRVSNQPSLWWCALHLYFLPE